MACSDEIIGYLGRTVAAERTFSVTQHWANGKVGHASGVINQTLPPNGVTVHYGVGNFSYDPYARNPIHFSLNSDGDTFISYFGPSGVIATEFGGLTCLDWPPHLFLKGKEQVVFGDKGTKLPESTFVNLSSIAPLWEHPFSKDLFNALKGLTR